MKLYSIAKRFRIDRPEQVSPVRATILPSATGLTADKKEAKAMLAEGIERLTELQERLYANDRWSVLIVLQAMDSAGKDSIIKHVMSGINPQGCEVHSFKTTERGGIAARFSLARGAAPAGEWRASASLTVRHYEEVLTVRVHRELLARGEAARRTWSARNSGSSVSTISAASSVISRATAR